MTKLTKYLLFIFLIFSIQTIGCHQSDNNFIPLNFFQTEKFYFNILSSNSYKSSYTFIKVNYSSKNQLNKLSKLGMDIWYANKGIAYGEINSTILSEINKLGINVSIINNKTYTSKTKPQFDKSYHTYNSMLSELREISYKYSNIAQLYDIGDSWEKTKGKSENDIWMFRITGNNTSGVKPAIVFFGGHHPREIASIEIPMFLINFLVDNYGKDKFITDLINKVEIFICPLVNPDGHIMVEKGWQWRKNTNDIFKNSQFSNQIDPYGGVDLNRNYGYKWSLDQNIYPENPAYPGKSAFSEPETQACRDFITRTKNIKFIMNYHSFGNYILWPWSWTDEPTKDKEKFEKIGKKLASFNDYIPQQSSELYICGGVFDDWSYGVLGIPTFTTELGTPEDGFFPSYTSIQRIWEENKKGAIYLIQLVSENIN